MFFAVRRRFVATSLTAPSFDLKVVQNLSGSCFSSILDVSRSLSFAQILLRADELIWAIFLGLGFFSF